jgi:hypothetical protein
VTGSSQAILVFMLSVCMGAQGLVLVQGDCAEQERILRAPGKAMALFQKYPFSLPAFELFLLVL